MIFSCRFVYFFGDLNYRIDELDIDVVKDYAGHNQVDVLLSYDQVSPFLVSCFLIFGCLRLPEGRSGSKDLE